MTISQELKKKAIKLGLCKEWTSSWEEPDLDSLVEMYISGLDFCILHNFPSNEYIKENFGRIAENHGVFTDQEVNLTNPDVAILNGSTKGKITFDKFVSRDIYIRHNSEVDIVINDSAKVFIRIFDNAKINIHNNSKNKVYVYKYSKHAKIDGEAIIREKEL